MRGTATAPNAPRDRAATFPFAISRTHGDSASKSNERQTVLPGIGAMLAFGAGLR